MKISHSLNKVQKW